MNITQVKQQQQMNRKIEKELEDAKGDIKDAIDAERQREVSMHDLKAQTLDIDDSMGAFKTESEKAKNRIWWKSAKWIAVGCVLAFFVVFVITLMIVNQLKKIWN